MVTSCAAWSNSNFFRWQVTGPLLAPFRKASVLPARSNVTRLPTAAKRKVRNEAMAIESCGNIIVAQMVSSLDIPVERILHAATSAGLGEVVVVGFDVDGEFYFGSSQASGPEALWLLEKAKLALLGAG
jgi:hypothetical protein